MRAHLAQCDIAWEDPSANYAKARALLERVEIRRGDLILLPEMFDTGFSLNVETTADRDGASARFLAELARTRRAYVVASLTAIGPDGGGRNRALCFDPAGAEVARYDKVHPFSFGREPERFSGGDRVAVFDWRADDDSLRTAPFVCYDLRFPELFRAGLALGAECFALGANWPAERAAHWRALAIARAIENQAFVLAVNRTGHDPHARYAGGSIAVDPRGVVLAEAGEEEAVLRVEIDRASLDNWRSTFPAWRDGRLGLLPRLDAQGRFEARPYRPSASDHADSAE